MQKTFELADVITVYSGTVIGASDSAEIAEVLGFLVGKSFLSEDGKKVNIPGVLLAVEHCRPYMLQQLPALGEVDMGSFKKPTLEARNGGASEEEINAIAEKWINEQASLFGGTTVTLTQLTAEEMKDE
jgi:hypothetical protein